MVVLLGAGPALVPVHDAGSALHVGGNGAFSVREVRQQRPFPLGEDSEQRCGAGP